VETGYLDNCIVPSGVVRKQLPPQEAAALRELETRRTAGEIALYTSHVTKEEIAKTPAEHRQPLIDLYDMYENVPAMEEEFRMPRRLGSLRSGLTDGPIVQDEALGLLLSVLPDELDARHIFQAAKNGLDYFITRDEETILKYAAEIRSAVGVQPLLPTELLQRLVSSSRTR
jgi:hypothetical protein